MLNRFQRLFQRLIRPAKKISPDERPALDDFELPEPLGFKEEAEEALPVADEIEPVDAADSRALPLDPDPNAVANGPERSVVADLVPMLDDPRSEPLPTEVPEWERARLAETPFSGLAVVEPLFFAQPGSTPPIEPPAVSDDLRSRAVKALSDILAPVAEQPNARLPRHSLAYSLPRRSPPVSRKLPCETPRLVLEGDAPTDGQTGFEARLAALLDSFERTTHDREQDQIRMLQRLEGLLQNLLDARPNLSHVTERLDELESAHVLRGRL